MEKNLSDILIRLQPWYYSSNYSLPAFRLIIKAQTSFVPLLFPSGVANPATVFIPPHCYPTAFEGIFCIDKKHSPGGLQ
jgi:hypothetical protein